MDSIDSEILKILVDDGLMSAPNISKMLKEKKISLTSRAVRKRIIALQKNKIVSSFTPIINDEASGKAVKRMVLVQFQHTPNFLKRLEEYIQYLDESPQCTFAVKVRGDLDWIHYKCFPNKEIADFEDDVFRQTFGDILKDYHSYDAEVIKNNFNSFVDESEIKDHLFKYADSTMIG